ncbi:hypothetical protein [uncultured Bacteroides sp.]|uniref:hypothetical protein n=1 Tax=uncultured Bacteroides sp. TaxID=162156 RepID=UPI00267543E3|nr:hypothetical protein [uncultured Bacteroides sp.]
MYRTVPPACRIAVCKGKFAGESGKAGNRWKTVKAGQMERQCADSPTRRTD